MSNEVTLLIDGKEFKFWGGMNITRPLDSFAAFTLSAPFDPDVPLLRNTFQPFTYKSVVLKIDGEPLLTGVLFPTPQLNPTSNVISGSGYSKPGVLNDCEFSPDAYPIEFNDVTLQTIADTAAQPFSVPVVFDASPGVAFEQVAAEPSAKILAFLIKLAKQRELLISDTVAGDLKFFAPIESGLAVAAIHQDEDRFIDGKPTFNGQQYYSSVTGLSPNTIARFSEQFTVVNPFMAGIVRPHTFTISDTTDVDIQTVVRAKAGRMFADAVRYEISVQGWRDDTGNVWAPNTLVKLLAPGIMVYTESEFIVKSVRLSRGSDTGDTATLSLVLPGVYNGKIPEALPWVA